MYGHDLSPLTMNTRPLACTDVIPTLSPCTHALLHVRTWPQPSHHEHTPFRVHGRSHLPLTTQKCPSMCTDATTTLTHAHTRPHPLSNNVLYLVCIVDTITYHLMRTSCEIDWLQPVFYFSLSQCNRNPLDRQPQFGPNRLWSGSVASFPTSCNWTLEHYFRCDWYPNAPCHWGCCLWTWFQVHHLPTLYHDLGQVFPDTALSALRTHAVSLLHVCTLAARFELITMYVPSKRACFRSLAFAASATSALWDITLSRWQMRGPPWVREDPITRTEHRESFVLFLFRGPDCMPVYCETIHWLCLTIHVIHVNDVWLQFVTTI